MKIAEVSKRYGVSTDTLRYYERIGLLRHVPRNKSGIRDYDEASCNAVEFVKCMRDAGMSIESLVEYMELLEQGDETTAARKELLLRQGDEIRERIAGLERALARLEYKIEHYDEVMKATERTLRAARAVVAVAGMEGALASVVGGLVSAPVIAVPTSVGYGASFGGVTALLAMLNSCASGVSVVNIDNGFGAAFQASAINHLNSRQG
ncbi:MAG: MerR family transcriptional regulator [Adlercreutzia sp.]